MKPSKRLTLRTETLLTLGDAALAGVDGAGIAVTAYTACAHSLMTCGPTLGCATRTCPVSGRVTCPC
jgi:hypothetical protein